MTSASSSAGVIVKWDSDHNHQGVNSLAHRRSLRSQTEELGFQSSLEDFYFEPWTSSPWLSAQSEGSTTHLDEAALLASTKAALREQCYNRAYKCLGARKKIRYRLPSFLLVHCFANAPYADQHVRYFISAHVP